MRDTADDVKKYSILAVKAQKFSHVLGFHIDLIKARKKSGGAWGTECLNTRLPLLTLLCAGGSVNLKENERTKAHVIQ